MRRKQKTQPGGWVLDKFSISLGHLGHIVGLRTLLALHDLELYLIALLKTLIAFRLYSAVVDENVRSTFLTDESKTLSVVEPLDSAFNARHLHTFPFLFGPNRNNRRPELPDHPWGLRKETYFHTPEVALGNGAA